MEDIVDTCKTMHVQAHSQSPLTMKLRLFTRISVSTFPSNSPYLTEYRTMTPFGSSGPLQLMFTLLSDVTLYVSLDTGPGAEGVGRNCNC